MREKNNNAYLKASGIVDGIKSIEPTVNVQGRSRQVADLVSQALSFVQYDNNKAKPLTVDNLAASKETNCYGYSIVTSEALSLAGIKNSVIYANRHAMNLAFSDDVNDGVLLSSDDNRFNCDLTSKILAINDLDEKRVVSGQEERTSAVLNTGHLIDNCDESVGQPEVAEQKRPWVTTANRQAMIPLFDVRHGDGEARFQRSHAIAVSVVSAPMGRRALESLYNFEYYVWRNNVDQATPYFDQIKDNWLEIDRHNLSDRATHSLNIYLKSKAKSGADSDIIAEDIYRVSAGIAKMTSDLMVKLWLPDSLRRLGTDRNNPDLIQQSIAGYEKIKDSLPKNRFDSRKLVNGKIAKSRRILKSIQYSNNPSRHQHFRLQ